MKPSVNEIVKYRDDINELSSEIEKLSASMSDAGGNRTVEQMQNESRALTEEMKVISGRISTLEGQKEMCRQTIITLERQISDSKARLSDISMKLMESQSISDRIDEFRKAMDSQTAIVASTDTELQDLVPHLLGAETKIEHITREGSDREKRQQREASKIAQSALTMQSIQARVNAYIDRGGPEQITRCSEQIRVLQKEVKKASDLVTSCSDSVGKMEREVTEASATERSISDNLRYRRNQRELAEILEEVDELEAENAEAKRDRFNKDADILANKHMRMSTEVCPISSLSIQPMLIA